MAEQETDNGTISPNASGEPRGVDASPEPGTVADTSEASPDNGNGAGKTDQPYAQDPRIHPSLRPASPSDEDGEAAEDTDGREPEGSRTSRGDRRFARLTKQAKTAEEQRQAAEERARRAEAENEALRRLMQQPAATREPEPEPEPETAPQAPRREDYLDEEGYLDEAGYAAAQEEHRAQEEERRIARLVDERVNDRLRQAERRDETERRRQTWQQKEAAYRQEHPTYNEDIGRIMPLLFEVEEVPVVDPVTRQPTGDREYVRTADRNGTIANLVTASEDPGFVHWLSDRPELLADIDQLDEPRSLQRAGMIQALYQLEGRQAAETSLRPPPRQRENPLPTVPRSGGSTMGDYLTEADVAGKSARWVADHDEQITRSLKAGKFYLE